MLSILDMVAIGPVITLPLIIGAIEGPQAMLACFLGLFAIQRNQ